LANVLDGDFSLNTNAQTLCMVEGRSREHLGDAAAQRATTNAIYGIVESPADQSWAEFCGSLNRPAFLLPESGFGELEQA
jgi:hypothetical protein